MEPDALLVWSGASSQPAAEELERLWLSLAALRPPTTGNDRFQVSLRVVSSGCGCCGLGGGG